MERRDDPLNGASHMIRAEMDQVEMHLPPGMLDDLGEKAAFTYIGGQVHVARELPSGHVEVLTYRNRQLVSKSIATEEDPSAN